MNRTYAIYTMLLLVVGFGVYRYISKSGGNSGQLPSQYLDDRTAFTNSLKYWGEGSDITNGGSSATADQTSKVVSLTEQSIASSNQVGDAFLDYLDPGLKDEYHNQFIAGEKTYLDGLSSSKTSDTEDSPSVKKQIQGSQMMQAWLSWWNPRSVSLSDKAFGK